MKILSDKEIERITTAVGRKLERDAGSFIAKLLRERAGLLSHIEALEDTLNNRGAEKHKPTERKAE